MKSARIKMNVWGNWNAYQGNAKVAEFGTRENEARAWLADQQKLSAVTIRATYHERDIIRHKWIADEPIALPARITPRSFIVRYGGDVSQMEQGRGNVRKILPRFYKRQQNADGSQKARDKWRQYIGSIERGTWGLIIFNLQQVATDGTTVANQEPCQTPPQTDTAPQIKFGKSLHD